MPPVRSVVLTHPLVVSHGTVCQNPYYVPPEDFLHPGDARREVDRLLKNISDSESINTRLREAKAYSDTLKLSEERFRQAWVEAPIGVGLCDGEGRLIETNKVFLALFGVVDAQAITDIE